MIRVFDPTNGASGHPAARFSSHSGAVTALAVHSIGGYSRTLISAGRDGTIRLWDTVTWALVRVVPVDAPVVAIAVHASGHLAVALEDGIVMLRIEFQALTVE